MAKGSLYSQIRRPKLEHLPVNTHPWPGNILSCVCSLCQDPLCLSVQLCQDPLCLSVQLCQDPLCLSVQLCQDPLCPGVQLCQDPLCPGVQLCQDLLCSGVKIQLCEVLSTPQANCFRPLNTPGHVPTSGYGLFTVIT